MLTLLPSHSEALCQRLNQKESLLAWRGFLSGEDYARHKSMETEPYDTTFSELFKSMNAFMNHQLYELHTELRSTDVPSGLLGTWLKCGDSFAVSKKDKTSSYARQVPE